LNHHYGGKDTAIFFDPPYKGFERLYHGGSKAPLVANAVAEWCKANEDSARIALCGHAGDYGGSDTTADECIWFSPGCIDPEPELFSL
jgi:hypothetical protein